MNDRDHLAADLHPITCFDLPPHRAAQPYCQVIADRLIALGWAQMDAQTVELLEALYEMNIYSMGDLHGRLPLDEERARIRAAVEKYIAHHNHEPGKNCVSAFCAAGLHAAILRIIDREDEG